MTRHCLSVVNNERFKRDARITASRDHVQHGLAERPRRFEGHLRVILDIGQHDRPQVAKELVALLNASGRILLGELCNGGDDLVCGVVAVQAQVLHGRPRKE